MTIRDIVAVMTGDPANDPTLDVASAIARTHDARVAALVPAFYPTLPAPAPGVFAPEIYASLYNRGVEEARARASAIGDRLSTDGVTGETRLLEVDVGGLGNRVMLHAWYADLVVLGTQDPPEQSGLANELLRDAVFGAGRPVLLAPAGTRWHGPLQRVAIGWRPGREAARAVHDFLALFGGTCAVRLLIVDADGTEGYGAEPGADIAAHLARHGAEVSVVRVPGAGLSVGEALLRAAADGDAQLLVMGSYGHSRLRQLILGGATRDVIASATLPVLMAH